MLIYNDLTPATLFKLLSFDLDNTTFFFQITRRQLGFSQPSPLNSHCVATLSYFVVRRSLRRISCQRNTLLLWKIPRNQSSKYRVDGS